MHFGRDIKQSPLYGYAFFSLLHQLFEVRPRQSPESHTQSWRKPYRISQKGSHLAAAATYLATDSIARWSVPSFNMNYLNSTASKSRFLFSRQWSLCPFKKVSEIFGTFFLSLSVMSCLAYLDEQLTILRQQRYSFSIIPYIYYHGDDHDDAGEWREH